MRIGINALFRGEPTGVANYICNLVYSLSKIDDENQYFILLSRESDKYIQIDKNNFEKVYPKVDVNRAAYRRFWEQFRMPGLVDPLGLDLFHCPMNVIPLYMKTTRIVTIIDTQYFAHPEHYSFSRRNFNKAFQFLSLSKASGVITISESVKGEIIHYFRIPADKIRVVQFGIDPCFLVPVSMDGINQIRKELGIPEKYILFVGFPHGRKNIPNQLKAFKKVKNQLGLPHVFVIAGDRGFEQDSDNAEIDRTIAALRMEKDVCFVGHVPGICTDGDPSDRKLPYLMAGADVFMFASFYEGFGLPVLEAMACNTPVLTSNIHIMKEVIGDAGVFTDPHDVDDIAGGLAHILQDPGYRNELVRKGRERIKLFSWQKNAEETLRYYEEIYRRPSTSAPRILIQNKKNDTTTEERLKH